MLGDASALHRCYEDIKREALERDCSILIFVALDVDSVCAAKILLSLLKSDFLSFKLVPTLGFDDLKRANEQLIRDSDEIRSIILINCGGIGDLTTIFDLNETMTVYVIDSHRPFHLSNLFGEKIIVFGDESIDSFKEVQAAYRQQEEGFDEEEEEEEEEEDMENVNDEEEEESGRRKKRKIEEKEIKHRSKKILEDEVDRILEEYYASNWTGSSVAGMLYVLAELLTKSTPTLLWYGIVGLTDQYINDKIGTEKYSSDLVLYHSAVQRLTPDLPTQSSNGEVSGSFEKERDQQQILVFEEYRFMLYRHWTLYDSMYHSSYMATKLGIWKEKGRKRLHTFLAKMGSINIQQLI